MKLFTPKFHRSVNCGYNSPNPVSELLMLSERANGTAPPPGSASVPLSVPEMDEGRRPNSESGH
jgi:hypothetical protein